jgi:hypothetical protein
MAASDETTRLLELSSCAVMAERFQVAIDSHAAVDQAKGVLARTHDTTAH